MSDYLKNVHPSMFDDLHESALMSANEWNAGLLIRWSAVRICHDLPNKNKGLAEMLNPFLFFWGYTGVTLQVF